MKICIAKYDFDGFKKGEKYMFMKADVPRGLESLCQMINETLYTVLDNDNQKHMFDYRMMMFYFEYGELIY